jgi:hypothetical protein
MLLGQDECIFKQFCLTKKSWTDPNGTRALLPKDEGQGVMISAITSRELGFGMELSPNQLALVNQRRKRVGNKHYLDKDAAIAKNGTTTKPLLTSSPFIRYLEYGSNNDGYWSYECMVLQLEDCVDCLKELHPNFDFIFLFDHSNGHDRMKPDGLNYRRVSKNFGGKQPKMRSSVLTDKNCFGKFHNASYPLQLGDEQQMFFSDTDEGPFYLSSAEKQRRKYDKNTGKLRKRYILKENLIKMLKDMNIINPTGMLKPLQDQCTALNLPITCTKEIIEEGWVGKPKGSLQILYERGWIDPANWKQYTEKGKVDTMGNLLEDTSLVLLLQKQPDFLSEITLLQYFAEQMGVTVDRTPKCHPELAGEGIEYLWAFAKLYYRYKPLSRKRTKQKFRLLVNESLSINNLNVTRARKCSKRAREYMLAYKSIEEIQHDLKEQNQTNNNKCNDSTVTTKRTAGDSLLQMNHKLIEKSIKTYKTHRNTRDFDIKFVASLELNDQEVAFVKAVVSKMKTSE